MYKTLSIILATAVLILATLIPTFVLNRRKQTSGEDWAIANRELPLFVVVGTQFASVFPIFAISPTFMPLNMITEQST